MDCGAGQDADAAELGPDSMVGRGADGRDDVIDTPEQRPGRLENLIKSVHHAVRSTSAMPPIRPTERAVSAAVGGVMGRSVRLAG
jgi:hypothetical protein